MNGLFLIDKVQGITSRKLDNLLGKKFGIKKVGHVGTLDPLATGLMLIAVNEGTKVIPFLEDSSKEYLATFQFGLLTTTLDLEGEVVKKEEFPPFTARQLKEVFKQFTGIITQIPPLTSAIKIDGVPLYKYAHQNIDVDVPPRQVEIYKLELVAYHHPEFTIKAQVSSGTYIRTLGNDIAHALGTFASTIQLRRTKLGKFSIDFAKTLENTSEFDIISLGFALDHLPSVDVTEMQLNKIKVGATITLETTAPRVKILDHDKLVAIYERIEEQTYRCLRGFNL